MGGFIDQRTGDGLDDANGCVMKAKIITEIKRNAVMAV